MNDNKDKMHPQDMRNLMIFISVSLLLWFAYETYVMKPQVEALKRAQAAKKEIALNSPEILEPFKPLERAAAINVNPRISFDSKEIYGTISLVGGRIDDARLHNYFKQLDKKDTVEILSPANTNEARYFDFGWVATDTSLVLPDSKTLWNVDGNATLKKDADVKLYWDNGHGIRFERVYSIDDQFVINVTQRVKNNSAKDLSLSAYGLVQQTGVPKDYHGNWMVHEGPMGFIGENLLLRRYENMRGEKQKETEAKAANGWIGISDKYWLTSLMPEQGKELTYRFRYIEDAQKKNERDRYQMDYTTDLFTVKAGQSHEDMTHIYVGAKKILVLEAYEKSLGVKNFDLAVDFGWFWFFTYPFFHLLHFIFIKTGNMGVAIILATVLIRSMVFPLTNFTYRSFAKMKKLQPQIAEIREKYKDDKAQLQKAMVELYQKEGVNPMAGCFPMLIQIPLFFAFYKILLISIELRHAPFFGWIQDLSSHDPTSVFNLFGLLPYDVPFVLMIGVWPCLLFAAFMVQKQLNPPPQDAVQRDIANWMPYVTVFLMAKFASGLVIYWTVSAITGVIQQMIIMKKMDVPIYLFNKDHYRKEQEALSTKGPSVHPLVDMVEQETEKALFGEGDEPTSSAPVSAPKPKKKKKKK